MHRLSDAAMRPSWRRYVEFLLRRRARILSTIFLALAVDSLGGKLLQHDLADVRDTKALAGLIAVLAGFTLLAWMVGAKDRQTLLIGSGPLAVLRDARYVGAFMSVVGLCLLIDEPKNIWLVLGPVILLDLIRVRREDGDRVARLEPQRQYGAAAAFVTSPARRKIATIGNTDSHQRDRWLRSRGYAPVLIVPIVVLAVIGYAWPFDSLEFHEVWEIRCLLVSFAGLAIRMLAAGQAPDLPCGRGNFGPAATSLNTDGVFSVVRHPRYVGDYFIGLGVVLIPFVWWLPVIYSLAFSIYYQRIIAIDEEALHRKFGKRFAQWASATPALVPRPSQWRPATNPFCFRTALRREYGGLFLVIALHSSVEWLEHLILERRVLLEVFWIVLAAAGLAAHLLVRHLEKHTCLLNAQPR